MSLDAQDWVWEHSQAKGTARLVLLAIADKANGADCSAYAGTTFLIRRSNAARSSVVTAVDKLVASGELAIVDGRQGPGGERCYRLPLAKGYRRKGGPKFGPVQNPDRSENETPGGPDSVPGGSENQTGSGPKTGPRNAVNAETPAPPPSAPTGTTTKSAGPDGGRDEQQQHPELARAAAFLQSLPHPWAIGPVSARAMAPDFLKITQEQGWALDAALVKKLTENPEGIKSYPTILRIRINDLPKAPVVPAQRPADPQTEWPPYCGECSETDRMRDIETPDGFQVLTPCPVCHPNAARKGAAA